MEINIEKLRNDLIDYFGTALFNGNSMAIVDLSKIEQANDYELIEIAIQNGFNLNNYSSGFSR